MIILQDHINDPAIHQAERAADIVTEKFSDWQANRNNASAEAIQEAKNIRDRTVAITAQKTAEAMHDLDVDRFQSAVTQMKNGTATQADTRYIYGLAGEAHEVGASVQRKLNPIMDAIVRGDDFLVGKLGSEKSVSSIVSKIKRKVKDPLTFGDLARGCFLIRDYNQADFQRSAQRIVDELIAAGIQVTEVDDKFAEPNDWGYRGLHVGVAMDGITCELQFATKEVWDTVKTPSEEIYNKWRDRAQDKNYRWSDEERKEFLSDQKRSLLMWENAVKKYHLPDRVDVRLSNSSHERTFASQMSQESSGATQAPSINSAYKYGQDVSSDVYAKNLPSYSNTLRDLSTDNMATPPSKSSISQRGSESKVMHSLGHDYIRLAEKYTDGTITPAEHEQFLRDGHWKD